MTNHITYEVKILIEDDLISGLSQREMALKRKVSKTLVCNINKKLKNGTPLGRKFGSRRPEILSDELKRQLFLIYDKNHKESCLKITQKFVEKFNVQISRQTVSRILSDFGLVTTKPAKKPLLRPINIEKRLNLSEKFLGISHEILKTIIFTDECKFNLFNSDGIKYVRYFPGQRYKPENTIPTIKHGGGSIMVWGCISCAGVGRIVFIEETMTAAVYKQLLANNLRQSACEMGLEEFILMQDNDPKHTSRLVSNWLDEKKFKF
ncbi:TCB1 [Hepatospora eriocheir]|uniref:TCB1 n=1 Tax=Hepatospora eriocheir TaxID=1081669 RepID=A0A1X0Q6I6_9MICR|nr:TCB1 [Hepatospora eriocheir]